PLQEDSVYQITANTEKSGSPSSLAAELPSTETSYLSSRISTRPSQIVTITAIPTVVKVVLNNPSVANNAMQPPSAAITTDSHQIWVRLRCGSAIGSLLYMLGVWHQPS